MCVTVGDLNHDNRLDIVVANYGTDTVGVLLGHGDGTFEDQITFYTGHSFRPYVVVVDDFNRDNQLDIATSFHNFNEVGILLGYGNGTFADMMGLFNRGWFCTKRY
jgi:hypothetical protein